MTLTYAQYLEESVSTDLMVSAQEQIQQIFPWTRLIGYYEAEMTFDDATGVGSFDDDEWDARLIVFVGETNYDVIRHSLQAIGYEEIVGDPDPDTGEVYTGFVRGYVDLIVDKSTAILPTGATIQGYDIGIYAERRDVDELGLGVEAYDPMMYADNYTPEEYAVVEALAGTGLSLAGFVGMCSHIARETGHDNLANQNNAVNGVYDKDKATSIAGKIKSDDTFNAIVNDPTNFTDGYLTSDAQRKFFGLMKKYIRPSDKSKVTDLQTSGLIGTSN